MRYWARVKRDLDGDKAACDHEISTGDDMIEFDW